MRKVIMTAIHEETVDGAFGTFSWWRSDSGFECYVVERPPLSQVGKAIKDHPRILDAGGIAMASVKDHPEHGKAYELEVPGRTAILIHAANWFQELLGCLAPGSSIDDVVDLTGKWLGHPNRKQKGVTSSHDTLKRLMADLAGEAVQITVVR